MREKWSAEIQEVRERGKKERESRSC